MGKVKEELLKMEYKSMDKLPNENLKEYLLTIESEYKPQAYEQDNYYLLKYCLLDLRSLETITISEKVPNNSLEQKIPKQLAKIMHETNHYIKLYDRFNYKVLINNGWLSEQYLFEAIAIKPNISSLNDLVILPSTEKAMIYYLNQMNDNLNGIREGILEQGGANYSILKEIEVELDLMNYLAQG